MLPPSQLFATQNCWPLWINLDSVSSFPLFRPDSVRAQSKLSFAAYVDMHQFQVRVLCMLCVD